MAEAKKNEVVYIDGTNLVLGRLSSIAAKLALLGKNVIILNCEKIVKTGNRLQIIDEYANKINNIRGRHKGPFWPKRPDTIVRKAIKRMLPYKRIRGKEAFRRVEVYIGVPKEYENVKTEQFNDAKVSKTKKFITIGELSERIGSVRWK